MTWVARHLRIAGVAASAGFLLAACGGGSGSTTSTTAAGGQSSDAAEFGLTEAEVTVRVDAVETAIAKCMTTAGFEYVPVDYKTIRTAMDTDSKPSGLDSDQFRTEFGYGISTLYGGSNKQFEVGLGRNLAIRDGLPGPDRVAWERALLGEDTSQSFAVGLDSEDLSRTGGCTRTAVEATFSKEELGPGFVNYQNADAVRVEQDPRVIDALRAWSTCMRDAGYSYHTSSDIDTDIASRLDSITGGVAPADLTPDAQTALTQLQGEERAIAAADNKCELAHVADVKAKVEKELLGTNGAN
ncbi:MAG: hypothetical protein ACT452_02855 [Microthrixaceae bacterium]